MATVYLATDLRQPRSVAVKVLREVADSLSAARFLREVRITANLVHPHILPLHDSGEVDGRLFYVMPYVAGETLRARLTSVGTLSVDEAIRITREIADALAYAHSNGIVHRDIKPENILLSEGHAVVADFGIGRAAGETLTGTGLAIGTPAYMSPEQATASRTIDGRADIYSLGCVLYEMLAGKTPFRGDTPQAIMAQQQLTPAPSLRTVRADVPPAVDHAVGISLAKDPTQRFETARHFAAALEATERPAQHERRAQRSARAALTLFILSAAALTIRLWPRSPPPLVTLAPFLVASSDPQLQSWRENLPTLIAAELDETGSLRASASASSFDRQPDVTDRAAAVALGQKTGAQYVVFGRVLSDRQRAVRVNAAVVDVARGEVIDELQATAAAASPMDGALPEMTDSLTRALLGAFGTSLPVAATRHAAFGCARSSWSAVTSYLRGEQFYRRTQFDSAIADYQRAIALDSGCALAYHRIATALGWQGHDEDSVVLAYRLSAGAHNHGLPPRDSLLVTADSLSAAVDKEYEDRSTPASAYWAHVRRLIATLEEASRRYPGDAEVWYALGDARYHHGWGPAAATVPEMLGAFDQAIRLDSGFAPSYLHPIELAWVYGGSERVMRYVDGYLNTRPTGLFADGVRLVKSLADSRSARSPETLRDLGNDTLDVLIAARNLVDGWADADEVAVRLTRIIAQRLGADTMLIARCQGRRTVAVSLATRLAYRGHFREALCALGDSAGQAGTGGVFRELALFGAVPDSMVERVYDNWLRTRYRSRNYALPWWAAHNDTTHIVAYRGSADSVLRMSRADAGEREWSSYDIAASDAYLALIRGDTGLALARIAGLNRMQCRACFHFDRMLEAQLNVARGSLGVADRILSEWRGPFESPSDVRIMFERGRIAERLGKRDEAIARYRVAVQVWNRADPILQSIVAAAKSALRRLGAE